MRCLILSLLLLLAGGPAFAELSDRLREQFHNQESLGIQVVTESNLDRLAAFLADPGVRVLVLQAAPEAVTEQHAVALLEWVRGGRTLWFYDARLAGWFGMKSYPLKGEQFRSRPEKGTLGEHVFAGAATTVLATGSHPVLTGVGQVTVFLPRLEEREEVYSAVAVEGDTVPLLQFTPGSPAVAALRREGRGLVVFKPLLWTKPLSGERFQRNLLEFSAGFPVPGMAGSAPVGSPPGPEAEYIAGDPAVPPAGSDRRVMASPLPPLPAQRPEEAAPAPPEGDAFPDRLEIAGEGTVRGRVRLGEVRFETTSESFFVAQEDIRTLSLHSPYRLDRLETRDGRVLIGYLMAPRRIEVDSPEGVQLYRKNQILRIDFGP